MPKYKVIVDIEETRKYRGAIFVEADSINAAKDKADSTVWDAVDDDDIESLRIEEVGGDTDAWVSVVGEV